METTEYLESLTDETFMEIAEKLINDDYALIYLDHFRLESEYEQATIGEWI